MNLPDGPSAPWILMALWGLVAFLLYKKGRS